MTLKEVENAPKSSGLLFSPCLQARLAQSAERKALNLVVVGSSPMVGRFAHLVWEHTSQTFTLVSLRRC